jgi:hypothetical protein
VLRCRVRLPSVRPTDQLPTLKGLYDDVDGRGRRQQNIQTGIISVKSKFRLRGARFGAFIHREGIVQTEHVRVYAGLDGVNNCNRGAVRSIALYIDSILRHSRCPQSAKVICFYNCTVIVHLEYSERTSCAGGSEDVADMDRTPVGLASMRRAV